MAMQRALIVAFLLALAALPLSAQRGGGHIGGGHVAMHGPSTGFGGHAGFSSGSHFSVGVGVGSRFASRSFAPRFGNGVRFFGPRIYRPRYSVNFGFSYGYPYYGYAAYWPYYSYPYPYAYYAAPSYPVTYASPDSDPAAQQLSQDVNDLRGEVSNLRDSNDQLRYELEKRRIPQDTQSQPRYPRPPVNEAAPPAQETPSTVLVFKDGRRLEANNYAVVGQTLWVLNSQQAQKYPVSQLDVEESRRLNAERGIDFAVPNR